MTNKAFVSLIVIAAAMFTTGSLVAHHAFAPMFDGENVINLKGVVTQFEWINPHSFIIVDVKGADGKTQQWALEGPSVNGLTRKGFTMTSIKPGEIVEACGYGARDAAPKVDPKSGVSRRIINVELLTLVDGVPQVWQDYGQRKCREAHKVSGL